MSFVDLMANVVWSDQDITNRTESMVRAEFSVQAEMILNRKMQGAAVGAYALTLEDQAEMARFQQICLAAQQEGIAARMDMALLTVTLDYEAALQRLAQAPVEEGGEGYEQDQVERAQAEAMIHSGVPVEVVELCRLRNPGG